MTSFQDRERAFEAKYAHDEEFRFLVTARRDKLVAHWAADRLGITDGPAVALEASFLALRDGAGHDALVLEELVGLWAEQGRRLPRAEAEGALTACEVMARQELLARPHGHPS